MQVIPNLFYLIEKNEKMWRNNFSGCVTMRSTYSLGSRCIVISPKCFVQIETCSRNSRITFHSNIYLHSITAIFALDCGGGIRIASSFQRKKEINCNSL